MVGAILLWWWLSWRLSLLAVVVVVGKTRVLQQWVAVVPQWPKDMLHKGESTTPETSSVDDVKTTTAIVADV